MSATLRRDEAFALSTVGEQHLLYPTQGGLPADVHVLLLDGPVALCVWQALSSEQTETGLVELVVREFEVDSQTAARDVATFLAQLERAGCLSRA